MIENHGLLGRTLTIRSGDLLVNLSPVGPQSTPAPPRDPFEEGDKEKKEFEELQYGSS